MIHVHPRTELPANPHLSMLILALVNLIARRERERRRVEQGELFT